MDLKKKKKFNQPSKPFTVKLCFRFCLLLMDIIGDCFTNMTQSVDRAAAAASQVWSLQVQVNVWVKLPLFLPFSFTSPMYSPLISPFLSSYFLVIFSLFLFILPFFSSYSHFIPPPRMSKMRFNFCPSQPAIKCRVLVIILQVFGWRRKSAKAFLEPKMQPDNVS